MTPTSTDPLAATLFAVRCRSFGEAVVLVVRLEQVAEFVGDENIFSKLESEVTLSLRPADFAMRAIMKIDVATALDILVRMGFEVPTIISGTKRMDDAIRESYSRGDRLTSDQIQRFVSEARSTSQGHGL